MNGNAIVGCESTVPSKLQAARSSKHEVMIWRRQRTCNGTAEDECVSTEGEVGNRISRYTAHDERRAVSRPESLLQSSTRVPGERLEKGREMERTIAQAQGERAGKSISRATVRVAYMVVLYAPSRAMGQRVTCIEVLVAPPEKHSSRREECKGHRV